MDGGGFDKRPERVRSMFGSIAGTYDLLNRVMTLGQDASWRELVARAAAPPPGGALLDVGAGTGGIALAALAMYPGLQVTGLDLTPEMLEIAKNAPGGGRVEWVLGDAQHLPFPNESFDAVTSGYLARNVPDLARAFAEQARVLRPGGRMACLDTAPPGGGIVSALERVYLRRAIPLAGQLLSGNREAYEYLPGTTEGFLDAALLAGAARAAGFQVVNKRTLMLGTQSLITAVKPG